jgi:hypothetical protein
MKRGTPGDRRSFVAASVTLAAGSTHHGHTHRPDRPRGPVRSWFSQAWVAPPTSTRMGRSLFEAGAYTREVRRIRERNKLQSTCPITDRPRAPVRFGVAERPHRRGRRRWSRNAPWSQIARVGAGADGSTAREQRLPWNWRRESKVSGKETRVRVGESQDSSPPARRCLRLSVLRCRAG